MDCGSCYLVWCRMYADEGVTGFVVLFDELSKLFSHVRRIMLIKVTGFIRFARWLGDAIIVTIILIKGACSSLAVAPIVKHRQLKRQKITWACKTRNCISCLERRNVDNRLKTQRMPIHACTQLLLYDSHPWKNMLIYAPGQKSLQGFGYSLSNIFVLLPPPPEARQLLRIYLHCISVVPSSSEGPRAQHNNASMTQFGHFL